MQLFVPLRHSHGQLVGILSVHDPVSGRVPGGDELDILSAMAEHAALAIQGAQEAAAAARHRTALEQLLTVSSKLTETFCDRRDPAGGVRGHPHVAGVRQRVHRPARARDRRLSGTRAAHGWNSRRRGGRRNR